MKEKWEVVIQQIGKLFYIIDEDTRILTEEQAKHIVKCVNNFDEMLESLKKQ